MLLIGGVVAVLPQVISPTGTTSYDVAVVGTPPPGFEETVEAVAGQLDVTVAVRDEPDRDGAAQAVRAGQVDGALVWPPGAPTGAQAPAPGPVVPDPSSGERCLFHLSPPPRPHYTTGVAFSFQKQQQH